MNRNPGGDASLLAAHREDGVAEGRAGPHQKVTADISLQQDGEEILYSFEGTFRDRILSGTYEATDEANFERGTILLKYTRKGTFVGRNAFLSRTSENLVSSPYEWTLVKRLSR